MGYIVSPSLKRELGTVEGRVHGGEGGAKVTGLSKLGNNGANVVTTLEGGHSP